MIALFTDFGLQGPYVGQMKAAIWQHHPAAQIVDLMHDAPMYGSRPTAYLLSSLATKLPATMVFLCVVDPGVGGARKPVILKRDEQWFVGPDNGLFDVVAAHNPEHASVQWWEVLWRPALLSSTFHGRDLFAPVAAMLEQGEMPSSVNISQSKQIDTAPDLAEVIYIDHYGNVMTGMRADHIGPERLVRMNGQTLAYASTFSAVKPRDGFWYCNSNGLLEIAVNQGSAAREFKAQIGAPVLILDQA